MREIEIKVKVDNLATIESKLRKLGYTISAPVSQKDTIFSSPGYTSKTNNVFMRIRKQSGKTIFNLKKQITGELDNLEYETEISNSGAMHKILLVLGFQPMVQVIKTRKTCKYKDYEICLDNVEELGCFVEIEKLAENNVDPHKVQKELIRELESLGLAIKNIETRGYDTQILSRK